MPGDHDPRREDLEALLETRRELGEAYDAALVDSFAERIERAVAERVDAQVAARASRERARTSAGQRQLALAIVSLVPCIPISIVLGLNDALVPLLVALAAIVGINVAHALQSLRGTDRGHTSEPGGSAGAATFTSQRRPGTRASRASAVSNGHPIDSASAR